MSTTSHKPLRYSSPASSNTGISGYSSLAAWHLAGAVSQMAPMTMSGTFPSTTFFTCPVPMLPKPTIPNLIFSIEQSLLFEFIYLILSMISSNARYASVKVPSPPWGRSSILSSSSSAARPAKLPRWGSRLKNPSYPASKRLFRIYSTFPSPDPAGTTLPSFINASLICM